MQCNIDRNISTALYYHIDKSLINKPAVSRMSKISDEMRASLQVLRNFSHYSDCATRRTTAGTGFDSWFSLLHRVQWIQRTVSDGKWSERGADHSLPSGDEVRNCGAIPLFPHTFSWRHYELTTGTNLSIVFIWTDIWPMFFSFDHCLYISVCWNGWLYFRSEISVVAST
jgi:hypothetical protein